MVDPVAAVVEALPSGWTTRDFLYLAGVIVSTVAAIIAICSARMASKRDLNSLGDSEIKLFELIAKCESELVDFNVLIKKAADADGENYRIHDADNMKLSFLIESVLNSYDIACQRYIDDKLDKERFKKTYADRIKNVCSNALYAPVIARNKIHYSALEKINTKLNDPESQSK
ncbi:TPA: hypothetical protein ACJHI9_003534 [Yersinia enterocolitica]